MSASQLSKQDLDVELPTPQIFIFDQSNICVKGGSRQQINCQDTAEHNRGQGKEKRIPMQRVSLQQAINKPVDFNLKKSISNREKIQDLESLYIFPCTQGLVQSKNLDQIKKQTVKLMMAKKLGEREYLAKIKENQQLALRKRSIDLLYRQSLYLPFDEEPYRFKILREKRGLLKNPMYRMFTLGSKGKFIMSGQKATGKLCGSETYNISLSGTHVSEADVKYLGKVKSNFQQTQWSVYDDGFNPNDVRDASQRRKQLAYFEYKQNFLGNKGPRRISVVIPAIDSQGNVQDFSPYDDINQIKMALENKQSTVMQFNDAPQRKDGMHVEYFREMGVDGIDLDSPKNLLFFHETRKIFCLGRVSEEEYILQVTYPLSAYQAFALCLTNFQFKPLVQGYN